MTAEHGIFARVNRVFENAQNLRIICHEIRYPPAGVLMRTSAQLFRLLDRSEAIQAEISRRLWVLRSSVLFTLLPFDHPSLQLEVQAGELAGTARGVPETAELVRSLSTTVGEIVSSGQNPKREWVLRTFANGGTSSGAGFGVLMLLSQGRPPGWPSGVADYLPQGTRPATFLNSRKLLKSQVLESVVLPCASRNAPTSVLLELAFSGRTTRLDVLLYPGERLSLPRRLRLPDEGIFDRSLRPTSIEREHVVVQVDPVYALDEWAEEAFWQGIHGACRSGAPGLLPANYVLFCDGTGSFFPEDGHVLTIPSGVPVTHESDLKSALVADVDEGDLIVVRSGDSGFLLDEAAEAIMARAGNDTLLDVATDWKSSLEALLVTHSSEEVAAELRQRGERVSAGSVHQWSGPDVLGPGDERVFKVLLELLSDKGKIAKSGADLPSYAQERWRALQDLRGVRQRAGNLVRQELFEALFSKYGHQALHVSDRASIRLDSSSDARLLILRVSSVDRNTAHVSAARLGQIDNLRGNKWLA